MPISICSNSYSVAMLPLNLLRPIIGASSWCFRGVGSFEEEFMKKLLPSWFEYMKVRFSWGRTGKDNIKAWGWKQLYSLDPSRGYGFGSNGGILQTGIKPGATLILMRIGIIPINLILVLICVSSITV